jgi:hypothetical protein
MTDDRNEMPGAEDPEAHLEQAFIEEYLRGRGYDPEALQTLPHEAATTLMREASGYAASRLAAIQARAHLLHDLHT